MECDLIRFRFLDSETFNPANGEYCDLRIAGNLPTFPIGEMREDAGGNKETAKSDRVVFKMEFAPFFVDENKTEVYNNYGDYVKFCKLHEKYPHVWIESTTQTRRDTDDGNIWNDLLPMLVVVTDDVSVTSEFEQGTDNIQMVCQSKNYFNIGDLV
jgi:hypothetical protein